MRIKLSIDSGLTSAMWCLKRRRRVWRSIRGRLCAVLLLTFTFRAKVFDYDEVAKRIFYLSGLIFCEEVLRREE